MSRQPGQTNLSFEQCLSSVFYLSHPTVDNVTRCYYENRIQLNPFVLPLNLTLKETGCKEVICEVELVTDTYIACSAGVLPFASKAPGSAPYTTSSSTCDGWPACAAMCRGQLPRSCTTVQRYNGTTVQRYNLATVQQYNSTTVQQYNSTTVQLYNRTTVQPYNSTTVQPCNSTTVQTGV